MTPQPDSFEANVVTNINTHTAWLVVLSVGLIAAIVLGIIGFSIGSDAQNATGTLAKQEAGVAHRVAIIANRNAKQATGISTFTLNRLQDEMSGSCYRVNYLRWQVDRERYVDWRRDKFAARFLDRIHHRSTTSLARYFRASARSAQFLPLTNCAQADGHPTTYHPPIGIPFYRVPKSLLHRTLHKTPQPPGTP